MVLFFLLILAVVLPTLIRVYFRYREEPCCSPGRGCNKPGFVMNRKCEYEQALREAEPWEKPALSEAWERASGVHWWLSYTYDAEVASYRAIRDNVLRNARARRADEQADAEHERQVAEHVSGE